MAATGPSAGHTSELGTQPNEDPPPLRSIHTSNFSAILQELGISVLVTTYQAGKLVMLRPDGERLNTHFRSFSRPMGLAVAGDRLAIGTSVEIWEYHNAPAVARRLEPAGSHDACFVPRSRPLFISALAPEDRCHLNGLCLLEGRPAFVTALGTTDTPGGWRA